MLQVTFARGNQMPFMTKDISNEKWKGQDCVIDFWKKKGQEIRMLYKGQRNYCGSRLRKTKSRYYTNLNENKILK